METTDNSVNIENEIGSIQLAKGGSIKLVGNVINRGFYALSQVFLARLLGPNDFGLFAIGWTLLQTAGLFNRLGLHQAVVRFGTKSWKTNTQMFKNVIWQSLGFVSILSFLTSLSTYVFSPWIAQNIFSNLELVSVLRGFSLALLLLPILKVGSAVTRISRRMKFSAITEDLTPPIVQLLTIAVIVLFWNFNIDAAIMSVWFSLLVGLVLVIIYIFRLFPELLSLNGRIILLIKDLLSFSIVITLASVFTNFTTRVDRLLVGYFLDVSDVGVYQTASQGAVIVGSSLIAFNAIFSPMIAKLHSENRLKTLNELFKVSTKWSLYLSLPIFLLIMYFPEEIIRVIFGKAYSDAAIPLMILSVGQIIGVGTGGVGMILIMTGHHFKWFKLTIVSFGINITVNIIAIQKWGLIGAALGTAFATATLYVLGLLSVKKNLNMWPYDSRYRKGVIAALTTSSVLYFARMNIRGNNFMELLILSCLALFVFGITLLIQRLEPEEKQIFHVIKSKIL